MWMKGGEEMGSFSGFDAFCRPADRRLGGRRLGGRGREQTPIRARRTKQPAPLLLKPLPPPPPHAFFQRPNPNRLFVLHSLWCGVILCLFLSCRLGLMSQGDIGGSVVVHRRLPHYRAVAATQRGAVDGAPFPLSKSDAAVAAAGSITTVSVLLLCFVAL